ncbi:hypothetical protein HN803_07050 [candidate division WWE3 bacterium]|jgi:hypothetical protein|nr:hypothetical protein [candidate division WWE3 bacterium]
MSRDFDFGFSLVDETELDAVQQISKVAEQSSSNFDHVQEKVDNLYNAITPLLNNLKQNPEKEYILWPNRVDKVEQFEEMLSEIYKS